MVEAQKIEERRVIIDRHAIDHRADEFATATLDWRQGEPVDQREAVARAVRVFDAVDQHHVVGAVFGALPMIGDPLSAVGGKSVAVQSGEMADVDDVLDMVHPIRIDVADLDHPDPSSSRRRS